MATRFDDGDDDVNSNGGRVRRGRQRSDLSKARVVADAASIAISCDLAVTNTITVSISIAIAVPIAFTFPIAVAVPIAIAIDGYEIAINPNADARLQNQWPSDE